MTRKTKTPVTGLDDAKLLTVLSADEAAMVGKFVCVESDDNLSPPPVFEK